MPTRTTYSSDKNQTFINKKVNQKVQDPNNIKSGKFLIHQGKQ